MNYEVTIPGKGPEDLVLNLTVEAPNWLTALRKGLAEVGSELVPSDSEIDIQPDGVIRVMQRSTQRTFVVRPLTGDAPSRRQRAATGRKGQPATAPQLPQVDATGQPVNPALAVNLSAPTPAMVRPNAPNLPFEPEQPTPIAMAGTAAAAVAAGPRATPAPQPPERSAQRKLAPPPPTPLEPRPRQHMTPIPPNKVVATPHRLATNPVSTMAPPVLTRGGPGMRQAPSPQQRMGTTPLSKTAVRNAHAAAFQAPAANTSAPDSGPGLPDAQIMAMVQAALPSIEKDFVTAEQVIDAAVDLAHNTVPTEATLFLLPAGDPRRGRVVAARGKTVKGFLGTVLPLTDDVADVLLSRRSVVKLNQVDWTLRFQGRHQGIMSLDVRSLIWAPVMHRGRLVSTLVLTNSKRPTGFTQGEHTALEQVCMSLAKALVRYL